jgi:hypothetical protein
MVSLKYVHYVCTLIHYVYTLCMYISTLSMYVHWYIMYVCTLCMYINMYVHYVCGDLICAVVLLCRVYIYTGLSLFLLTILSRQLTI